MQAADASAAPDMASAVVLAVVQGLTEFLPVSSSGHLVLAEALLGLRQSGLLLPVVLHLGTLLAVVAVYRLDLLQLLRGLLRGEVREIALLAVATLPSAGLGLGLHDFFESRFGDPGSAALGLLATATILVAGDARWRRRAVPSGSSAPTDLGLRTDIGFVDALLIGCGQALALFPGVSRSGTTISVGMLRGIEPAAAARFSFLMSVPAILGAVVLEVPAALGEPGAGALVPLLLLGLAIATVVGWFALKWLLAFVERGAFRWFALYCALVGAGYLLFA